MSTRLLLTRRGAGAQKRPSAFFPVIAEALGAPDSLLACPYISVTLLRSLVTEASTLLLLTDDQAWLLPFSRKERLKIVEYVRENHRRIRTLRDLHAKVVVGAEVAYLGSANLTLHGIDGNYEAGVTLRAAEDMSRLRDWFNELWEVAEPIDLVAFELAAEKLPEPEQPADDPQVSGEEERKLVKALAAMPGRAYAETYLDFLDLGSQHK
jgi:PLD-like domain